MTEREGIEALWRAGFDVELTDIPGLYRVIGFPELTFGQLCQVASEHGDWASAEAFR